jgi:hypothetical protein
MSLLSMVTMGILGKRTKDAGGKVARVNPEEGNPLHYQTHMAGKKVPRSKTRKVSK